MTYDRASALRAAGEAADRELTLEPIAAAKKRCATRWLELMVVNDRDRPLKRERVWLHVDGASPLKAVTDDRGVARWDTIPDGGERFQAQLVDVLEAWGRDEPGIPKPEAFRARDRTVHDVEPEIVGDEQRVVVDKLTEPEKLAYFEQMYTDNGARYRAAKPGMFESATPPRWRWGGGAECNQHVNFFLAFWFNYNASFTAQASRTFMDALPELSSDEHTVTVGPDRIKHRGYKELVAPIKGGGHDYDYSAIGAHIDYHWVHAHFDERDGSPHSDLMERLGTLAVYSISDEAQHIAAGKAGRISGPLDAIRTWIKAHPERSPGKPASRLTPPELWAIAHQVKRGDADADALLSTLWKVIVDHHAGVVYRKPDGKLYTFSADSGGAIHEKTFLSMMNRKKNLWMAFWRLLPLRKGGFAPEAAEKSGCKVSVDNPCRFIEWVGGGGAQTTNKQASTRKQPVKKKR